MNYWAKLWKTYPTLVIAYLLFLEGEIDCVWKMGISGISFINGLVMTLVGYLSCQYWGVGFPACSTSHDIHYSVV